MANYKLDWDFELEMLVYGISYHDRDFKLAFELNKYLQIDLSRDNDYAVSLKNEPMYFTLYTYKEEDSLLEYKLISNKSYQGPLIPEFKQFDMFLIIDGAVEIFNPDALEALLSEIPGILAFTSVDANTLKSKQNLIFE